MYRIPFNKPFLTGAEIDNIQNAFDSEHISGDGHFTERCSKILCKITKAKHCLLTTSCTHALELAGLLLDLKEGDEFIVPSFTFVSTANAFSLRGAKPVFCDIRPDTLNLDESKLKSLITAKTKLIVPVHYGGVACEMESILDIARQNNIAVVEDNAHGLFGRYKDIPLGSLGCMSALSFHETKNISCGEGGALCINDDQYLRRAEIIREKGTNRSQFFRGEIDKYSWVDIGSSYLPSDILAAFLFAQLSKSEQIQRRRRHIWETYNTGLAEWAEAREVQLPTIPEHCQQAYHMFYMLMPTSSQCTELIDHLKTKDILSVFHYQPLHLSKAGLRLNPDQQNCPVTEDIYGRLVRLPFYNSITDSELSLVIETIRELKL